MPIADAQATAPAPRRRAAAMPFIMLTVLIDMISIGLIIPVLPALVGTFTHSQTEQAQAFRLVAVAFGLANFVGSPVMGALSDRFGRRPVLLLGFSGLALSFFVTAMATALWMLVAVRLVAGLLQSNIAVANAYVADVTPPEQRAKNFGMLGAMFGLGFILGPLMGGFLGKINLHLPFFVAGGLALTNWLYGFFVLPESLPPERRHAIDWRSAHPVAAMRKLGALRAIGALVYVIALAGLSQFMLQSTWVLYTQMKFGWGPLENAESLAAVGLMSVIVQGGLMRHLLKLWPVRRLAVLGLISSSLCYLAWGAATAGWMMYVVIFMNILGFAASSSMQSLVSNAADDRSQGQIMGALSALNSMMAVLAPMIGPTLLVWVGHLPHGDWRIGAPYYFCAGLQALAAALAIRHFRHHPSTPPSAAGAVA